MGTLFFYVEKTTEENGSIQLVWRNPKHVYNVLSIQFEILELPETWITLDKLYGAI